jgi:hypothetical protein
MIFTSMFKRLPLNLGGCRSKRDFDQKMVMLLISTAVK